MDEKEPVRIKTKEELESEFEKVETAILEVVTNLLEYIFDSRRAQIEKLDDSHHVIQQKLNRGEINIAQALREAKKILRELESFSK